MRDTKVGEYQKVFRVSDGHIDLHIERDGDVGFGPKIHIGLECVGWEREDKKYTGSNLTFDVARDVAHSILEAIGEPVKGM